MVFLLQHLLERSTDSDPDHLAFGCLDDRLTYADLWTSACRLAQLLVDHGVKRGDRVAIQLPRCVESSIAVYGVLLAGGAYVPIDPSTPTGRVEELIHLCGIRHFISLDVQAACLERLATTANLEMVICRKAESNSHGAVRLVPWKRLKEYPGDRAPRIRLLDQDLAYVMFTSGSTGQPKGIMHTHASGLSYAGLAAETYELGPADRIGNHSPLHFDMSTLGYFSGPYAGATTIVIPGPHTRLPASLSQLMEHEQISVWYSVPMALIQLHVRGALHQRNLECLRWVLFGGEPFPPKYLRSLMATWPQARFSNVYGPAEVNQCTYYHLPRLDLQADPVAASKPIPIGRTWPNTESLILSESGEEVAPGASGELLIRSATMMAGYWGRPDLNARAFFRQTLAGDIENVFYRTGDIVKLDENGDLLFLGRRDRQIKVRGYRVELDEIELVLATHPRVEEAAAYAVQSSESSQIEAAVTGSLDDKRDEEKLRTFVGSQLPSYCVPHRIHVRDTMPRTTSGKIDRRALACLAYTNPVNNDLGIHPDK